MSDIVGLITQPRSNRLEQPSSQERIAETLQSVIFSDPASVQQARDNICRALGDALGDHLFEHGAKQSGLQQVATLALAREAQRQGYGDVLGLTSHDLRMAQVILVSHLSPVAVKAFVHGELNQGHDVRTLEFRFESGRPIDILMTLSFPEPNLGYELKDLPGGGEQLISSLVATAINEARDLDPAELDWEIQVAVTKFNSSPQTKLPDEMLQKIQSYMPSRDLDAMRCVDRKHSAFDAREVATAQELTKRAANVRSKEAFEAVFKDIQKLSPGYRQKPLAALIKPTQSLPGEQQPICFNRVLAAAEQLSSADRARLLTVLAGKVGWLYVEYSEDLFQRILSAVEQLKIEHQGEALVGLADEIVLLPTKETRKVVFDRILENSEQLKVPDREVVLHTLFRSTSGLPPETHITSCNQILDAVERLDKCNQGQALIVVARIVSAERSAGIVNKEKIVPRLCAMAEKLSSPDRQQISNALAQGSSGGRQSTSLSAYSYSDSVQMSIY
ncbi:hypothetical protein IAG25_34845 [Caballeronia sp. EK]|uniref:hypothetical protein n=1 Tax=Caballeronia sp. EK TaxID=2767469 RepID=UPI001655958B|nr:hypothetical protein [Caballeronia sp. EK]MBC8642006.1 hypothetical protein [Caballeronia sp. EK]